ncbi:MAG: hypothetical protein GXY32_04925 [Ruminococcaceae bacterium]|nr:hypothetical protein [Oscillospiraceae bacterium]
MHDINTLEKTVVSQAVEICDLREKLAQAKLNEELWYKLYNQQEEKEPADAGTSTDE